jgi:hypothetical protein
MQSFQNEKRPQKYEHTERIPGCLALVSVFKDIAVLNEICRPKLPLRLAGLESPAYN